MDFHGFDPGDPNKWYQSPHLGLIPAGYGGEIAGNCSYYSAVGASYQRATHFTHPISPPPPHHFTQPNHYPPPQHNYYAPPPSNFTQPQSYASPHHFTPPDPYPPPEHNQSATLISGHLLPHQLPYLVQTPPPPNPYCAYAYPQPGNPPTQPYLTTTNQFVHPDTTQELPPPPPAPGPQLCSTPLQLGHVSEAEVPNVDTCKAKRPDAKLSELLESVGKSFDSCISKCIKRLQLFEGSLPTHEPKAPDPVGNVTAVVDPTPISFGSLPVIVGGETLTGVAAAASSSVPTNQNQWVPPPQAVHVISSPSSPPPAPKVPDPQPTNLTHLHSKLFFNSRSVMGAKARVYKKTRTPPLHSGVGCDIRPKLHRKRRIWVAKANPGVFFPEFDEALCHLSMGSTSLPHTSPQTATNPSSSPVFSVSEQQGVYLSVAVPEEAGFTSSECKRDEEKPAEPEGSTSVLSPGSTTLAISGISTDSIKGVSANSISGSNKNFTYRELGHNEVTLGLKNDVFPHLNDAPLESLNTGVDLSSVAWTQPCATAIVGLNIIRPSRVGGTLVMDIDHIVGGSSDVGHYWQVNSAVVNSGRHTNVHGGNLMDSRQVQYSPPVVGCTRAVEAVRPNFVVNFGKRADSGGGRNSMPQDSQVAPPNFGPNPFNYMTGPFSATHVGANLNQIGIAPTSHVSTVEPHTMPQPSFGPNFGSIYTPIPHTGPQVKPSYNQPNPYLPQTHTYTFPGNQTYPPHPIFGTQTAHGAWLQQSPTSYQQTHSTLPHYTPPLSTPPNLNFAHQNPNFAFQNPNFDQSLPTMKPMKLEFTTFNGGDPVEWISKAEQFFEFYQVPEERKLAIGTMHLVEKASDRWYMFKHEFQQNWQGLTELLMREFGGYHASDYQSALARMSQVGTIDNYTWSSSQSCQEGHQVFSQQVLPSIFVGGIKGDIRADERAMKPKTLYAACELAKFFEEKEVSHIACQRTHQQPKVTTAPSKSFSKTTTSSNNTMIKPQGQNKYGSTQTNSGTAGNFGGAKRLSLAKFQERRARNQCFFCDELFRLGHHCRKGQGQLMVIEVVQEEQEETDLMVETLEGEITKETPGQEIQLQIMGGFDGSDTMQVNGMFNKYVFTAAVESVDQLLRARDDLLAVLKRNLQVAQSRMKTFYDKKHKGREFVVGDWEYLKLQHYKHLSLQQKGWHKLSPLYFGPFQVVELIGKVAYTLLLPSTAKIHNVFHVSLLKKKLGTDVPISPQLPHVADPIYPRCVPMSVLARRIFRKKDAAGTQWLVQWKDSFAEEATWADADVIKQRFPEFAQQEMAGPSERGPAKT